MELKNYLKSLPASDRKAFAQRCGTSLQYLYNITAGFKTCGEKLAIEIEKNSARAVTCEEMRSDVDWAYLRGNPATPQPTPQTAS
jgi:DNA-binding transcriptional regulator YdaS (Cro superfamily)